MAPIELESLLNKTTSRRNLLLGTGAIAASLILAGCENHSKPQEALYLPGDYLIDLERVNLRTSPRIEEDPANIVFISDIGKIGATKLGEATNIVVVNPKVTKGQNVDGMTYNPLKDIWITLDNVTLQGLFYPFHPLKTIYKCKPPNCRCRKTTKATRRLRVTRTL